MHHRLLLWWVAVPVGAMDASSLSSINVILASRLLHSTTCHFNATERRMNEKSRIAKIFDAQSVNLIDTIAEDIHPQTCWVIETVILAPADVPILSLTVDPND